MITYRTYAREKRKYITFFQKVQKNNMYIVYSITYQGTPQVHQPLRIMHVITIVLVHILLNFLLLILTIYCINVYIGLYV